MAIWASWADVPVGEQNSITGLVDVWLQSIGFAGQLTTGDMLNLANAGVETQHDLGQYASRNWPAEFGKVLSDMPWGKYGLDKDTYVSMAGTFGTEYKKITGQDISAAALGQAFQNPRDPTGGLLTASQYGQQLMNDTAIQKTYGWVKYGMDFSQWTQQKLQMRTAFGRDINDAEAATMLQYNKTASGSNVSVIGREAPQRQQQPSTVGVGQSVVR